MQPAAAWDYGKPMIAHPELEEAVARGRLSDWLRRSRDEQLREQRQPSFRLDNDDVRRWLEQRTGEFELHLRDNKEHLFSLPLDHALGLKEQNHVWAHAEQLCVLGPNASTLSAWLIPHQAVNANAMVAVFRQDLRVRNPFVADEYRAILDDARRYGLDLYTTLNGYGALIAKEPEAHVLAYDRRQEERARKLLQDIACREWKLERGPTLPFWFSRAAQAPLLLLSPGPSSELDVVASMGAGRVLRIRMCRFAATSPRVLSAKGSSSFEVDGGDVHVWLRPDYDSMLDGDSPILQRRRQEDDDD